MSNRSVHCRVKSILRVLWFVFPFAGFAVGGSPAFGQNEGQFGKWEPPPAGQRDNDPNDGGDYGWELITYTAALLSTGKVLVWEQFAPAKLWNPTDGLFTGAPCDCAVLYCSGHSFLKDGSLLVPGGLGTAQTRIFRPTDERWEVVNPMAHTRFYPTCTTLPDGRVLTVAGAGNGTEIPEIYDPGTGLWDELSNPEAKTVGIAEQYPFLFLLPAGKVFFAGGGDGLEANPDPRTFTLDVQNEVWAEFPLNSNSFFRGNAGAAVMYERGKILKAGGVDENEVPVDKVAKIEIDPANPENAVWELLPQASSLPEPRHDHHLVLLPDGKILLVGGHDGTDYIKDARMFDPSAAVLEWKDMADMVKARGHHAVALLLPDATVLSAGGPGSPDPATAEIYRPPYLFAGPRPVIAPPPSSVQYGCQFLVTATPIGDIDRVTLVRPAAVTHWFDQDQRFLELTFTVVGDELLVDAPANANLAPPGLLYVVRDQQRQGALRGRVDPIPKRLPG